jgi:putative thioredoxin
MGISVEVDRHNFATDVVEASHQRPVLVDFFAQWCGPCQLLKPMLEKLALEYDFVLAKVDIDRSPDLAKAYRVEGVPDVRIVHQGQMAPGFVGVLPEPKLRELLASLNLKSQAEMGLATAEAALATGDVAQIRAVFAQLQQQYPQDGKIAIAYAKFLVQQDELGAAEGVLAAIESQDREMEAQTAALHQLIQLKLDSEKPPEQELDPAFFAAVQQILAGEYEAALQELLAIVSKDRRYRQDGARKAMLIVFALLGDADPLVRHYRKQLTLTLY